MFKNPFRKTKLKTFKNRVAVINKTNVITGSSAERELGEASSDKRKGVYGPGGRY